MFTGEYNKIIELQNDSAKRFLLPSLISIRHADTTTGSILSLRTWPGNQWHGKLRSLDFPPWKRLEVTDLSTQHLKKQGTNKERWLHFTASESPVLKQRRWQVFSAHHPWQNPSWHPFNMGSPLPEWRPQPLGAPDTPSPWHAVPALAKTLCKDEVMVFSGGGGGSWSAGSWTPWEGGFGSQATALVRLKRRRQIKQPQHLFAAPGVRFKTNAKSGMRKTQCISGWAWV